MNPLYKKGSTGRNVPLMLLMVISVIEFLFITLESLFSGIGYYLAETYVVVPCLLLLGYTLREKPTAFVGKRLLLAAAMVFWFVAAQCIHKLSGMENHPMGTVLFVYFMGFPFAALADDRKNAGLRCIGGMFVAAALVLVLYTVLLLLDLVPAGLEAYVFWDGARLHPLWHPNIAASYFMISIGFCLFFCCNAKRAVTKLLLTAAIFLQLPAMALTNCRTTLLLTGALLGGTLFFLIFQKGGWKRFLLGLLVAALVLAGSFKASGMLFQWNNDRLLTALGTVQEAAPSAEHLPVTEAAETEASEIPTTEAPAVENAPAETLTAGEKPEEETLPEEITLIKDTGIILGDNEQGSFAKDMRSLNGRTLIWKSALCAIRDNKVLALWGTEYPGTAISVYNPFPVIHAHNAWMETLMRMGLPGLLMSLIFAALSAWNAAKLLLSRKTLLWQKIIAMLAMCVMATGFLEPYLFITNVYYHVTDFVFFFLTGYLDHWCNRPAEKTI